jgi:hypothetical protein
MTKGIYAWFVKNYGKQCWELDAMDPNDLRACVKREIKKLIEPVAWRRCEVVNKAEQESLRTILQGWGGGHECAQEPHRDADHRHHRRQAAPQERR